MIKMFYKIWFTKLWNKDQIKVYQLSIKNIASKFEDIKKPERQA